MKQLPISLSFYEKIKKTVEDFSMLNKGDRVLAAVSGGPDSVALVQALLFLQPVYDLEISIAHFNHQLRGENARRDQTFSKQLADRLDLNFFCAHADVRSHAAQQSLSVETAGRNLRYAFFKTLARQHGYTRIATGHHKDDNAEQVLMNLIRGSGPEGLSGIPPVRDKTIIRPLIQISKQQILGFLNDNTLEFVLDASNQDNKFLRNRIRSQLLPLLREQYNPEITEALDRLSDILRSETSFWQEKTADALFDCTKSKKEGQITLMPNKLAGLEKALKRRVLRKAIKYVKGNLHRISHGHIQTAEHFLMDAENGKNIDLPGQLRIYKTREGLLLKKEDRNLRDIGKEKKEKQRAITEGQQRTM